MHVFSDFLCVAPLLLLPLEDQIEPVPDHGHPQEPQTCIPPHIEPDWEEPEEGGVQISHGGGQSEQVLILAVAGLEVDRQLNPPAVDKIHDTTT